MPKLPLLLCLLPLVAAAAASLPESTVDQTCCVQLKSHNCTADTMHEVAALGIRWVRRGFIWGDCEKAAGTYDFTVPDQIVADAEANGLKVLGCISGGNKLYGHVKEDAGRAGYARFAAALAERYRTKAVIWELWNEPNNAGSWGKHGVANNAAFAAEYTALVRATVPAMKAADPQCTVVAGAVASLGWDKVQPWIEACFAAGILDSGIDAWSVHPYSTKRPEDYTAAYAMVRDLMRMHGHELPLFNSERGYPVTKAEGWTGGEGDLAQFQAWHCARQLLVDQLNGIRLSNWYEWSGKESFSLHIAGPTVNPAETACTVLLTQLTGYRFAERVATASPEDYVLRFTATTGPVKFAAWTAPAPGLTPDQAVAHALTVKVGSAGEAVVTALDGSTSRAPITDGTLQLQLSGAPQYVTLP